MIIALCLQRVGIEPIHSSRFHQVRLSLHLSHIYINTTCYCKFVCHFVFQARPIDYPEEVLLYNEPISFHKFWQIDPYYVYEHWLHQNAAINEVNKYTAERTNDNYCNKNQNEFCHKNSYDENN